VTLSVNCGPVAEEVIKHYIINNNSGHDGWIQTERMKYNTQNVGTQLSRLTGALHGAVKQPALVVQWLPAAAVMFGFTEQFLTVFAHYIAPQIKIIKHAGRSDT